MSLRYNGGFIGVNAPVVSQAQAPGVWTQSDVTIARAANVWPINGIDPYFKNTTLLLHGDQTSNFLTDLSPNIFTVTPNGNPQSSQFTPFFGDGYYSNLFNGSTDYWTVPSNTALAFGTGDFTVECWFYKTSTADGAVNDYGSAGGFGFVIQSANILTFSSIGASISFGATIPLNVWNHLAIVRSSGTLSCYLNGNSIGTPTADAKSYTSPAALTVGKNGGASSQYFPGSIYGLRLVKGVAVYTGNFAAPIGPLQTSGAASASSYTSTTNVNITFASTACSLLSCQYNRFKDNSSNNFAITTGGTPKISAVIPVNLVSTAAVAGGSGNFNGSTDFLSLPFNAIYSTLPADFTIEFNLYFTSHGSFGGLIVCADAGAGFGGWSIVFNSTTNGLRIEANNTTLIDTATTLTPNAWTHVAVVRSGSLIKCYINGVADANTATNSATFTANGTPTLKIAVERGGTLYTAGNFANVRIIKGAAVYTGNFTPPIAMLSNSGAASASAYPSTTNVNTTFSSSLCSLLTLTSPNAQNNNIFQDSSQNYAVITRNGTPTQGTLNPFGNLWSNYFNGSTDYITIPSSSAFDQTVDFTLEGFISLSATPAGSTFATCFIGQETTNYLKLSVNSSNKIIVDQAGVAVKITSVATLTLGLWYHIALVRNGSGANNLTLFVNGAIDTQVSNSLWAASANTQFIGRVPGASNITYFPGYISNLRIVKGTALYTNAFTPPTTPLSAVSGTSLLTCQSNRFIDNSLVPQTLTLSGTPKVQNFSPFAPPLPYSTTTYGGSGYFNGTTDYLTTASTAALNLSSGDFTIDAIVYYAGTNTGGNIIEKDGVFSVSYPSYGLGLVSGAISFSVGSGNGTTYNQAVTSASQFPLNQWVSVTVTKSGSVLTLYVNGSSVATATQTGTIIDGGKSVFIGYQQGQVASNYWNGYIAAVRIVKGSAITPPAGGYTSILTATTNTSLLLNFTNGAIIDNTAENDLITVGDTRISTAVKKYGTGSIFFDGTGDYLSDNITQTSDFGTGDFTVEFWMNASAAGTYVAIVGTQSIAGATTAGMWRVSNRLNSVNGLYFNYTTGSAFTDVTLSTANINDGAWHFIAITRASGQLRGYIDGLQVGATTSVAQNLTSGQKLYVGFQAQDSTYYTGYIDDLRITKGIARYTGSTCPVPAVAFPNQ